MLDERRQIRATAPRKVSSKTRLLDAALKGPKLLLYNPKVDKVCTRSADMYP